MPYNGECYTGDAMLRKALDVGFVDAQIALAHHMQVIYSSFTDPGEDWERFELRKADETVVATKQRKGY